MSKIYILFHLPPTKNRTNDITFQTTLDKKDIDYMMVDGEYQVWCTDMMERRLVVNLIRDYNLCPSGQVTITIVPPPDEEDNTPTTLTVSTSGLHKLLLKEI